MHSKYTLLTVDTLVLEYSWLSESYLLPTFCNLDCNWKIARYARIFYVLTLSPNFLWQEGHFWNSSSALTSFLLGVGSLDTGTGSNPSVRFLAKSKTFLFLVLTFWQTLMCLSKAFWRKVRPQMVQGKSWPLSKALLEGDNTLSSSSSKKSLNPLLLDKAGKAISSLKNK